MEGAGVETEEADDQTEGSTAARLYGLKWLAYDRRNPTEQERDNLLGAITDAGFARGRVGMSVRAFLFTRPAMRDIIDKEYRAFLLRAGQQCTGGAPPVLDTEVASLLSRQFNRDGERSERWTRCESEYWTEWANGHAGTSFDVATLSDEELAGIDRIIEENLEPFVTLAQRTESILGRVRTAPQLALIGTYKDLPGSGRAYIGGITYDYGLTDRQSLTLNAGYESMELEDGGERDDSWKVAGQLRYQLSPETLVRKASHFDLAGEAKRIKDETTYKIQLKTVFPWIAGVSIPASLTYASDPELIDEEELRGQIGFTIDMSKLVEPLRLGTLFRDGM